MAIFEFDDIIKRGNPFEDIMKYLTILDKQAEETKQKMLSLEKSISNIDKSINGSSAKALTENIEKLSSETKKLTEIEKAELAIKQAIEKANAKLIIAQTNEALTLEKLNDDIKKQNIANKEQLGIKQKEIGAYKELSNQLNKLRTDYKNLAAANKQNTEEGKKQLAQIQLLDAKLKAIDNSVGQNQRSVGKYSLALQGLGEKIQLFIAGLGIQQLFSFGKEIINTRAEFQKYEIVLENSLGSQRKAAEALGMIEEFAAKTPFSVAELTASYIKLVNQGFKPTQKELTKLGDLASSTGKSFDQLTEAIIDAGTFEFERLKEFGIRAKKEGDNITFTFKNQETTVKATNESIRAYILSLGELPGVLGANEKIAQGLTGQISNLGDAWDGLKNTIGKLIEVPVSKFLGTISEKIKGLRYDLENTNNESTTFADRMLSWTKIVGRLNPVFSFLVEKLGAISFLEGKVKEQRDAKIKSEKENLITQEQYNDAVQRGINEAQIEYYELHKNDELKKKTKKTNEELTASQIAEIKAKKELNEQYEIELQRRLDLILNTEDTPEVKPITTKFVIPDTDPRIELEKKVQKNINDITIASNKKLIENEAEKQKQIAELKKQTRQLIIDETIGFATTVFNQSQDKKLAKLKDSNEAEKEILKDKLDKQQISQEEYNAKIAEMNQKEREAEARAQKKKALFDIAIDTAVSIVKSISKPWLIPYILGQAALQAAVVLATPIPKFAKGTDLVQGEGTDTSDSIPALLSKNEGVIPAKINKNLIKTGITATNPRLPEIVQKGLNFDRLEKLMEKNEKHSAIMAFYLSNGQNAWIDDEGFMNIQPWRSGERKRHKIKK